MPKLKPVGVLDKTAATMLNDTLFAHVKSGLHGKSAPEILLANFVITVMYFARVIPLLALLV